MSALGWYMKIRIQRNRPTTLQAAVVVVVIVMKAAPPLEELLAASSDDAVLALAPMLRYHGSQLAQGKLGQWQQSKSSKSSSHEIS